MPFTDWTQDDIRAALSFFGDNPYLQALIVALISVIVAKLTDWFITRGILRLTGKTRTSLDDKLVRILHRPIFTTVLLIGLLEAFLLATTVESVEAFVRRFVASLVVLIWLIFGIRAIVLIIEWASADTVRFKFVQPATKPLLETGAKLFLIAIGIYFVLITWGVNPVGWIASAGIAAVALGLAAQDTLGNLFAGISILADNPYGIGDYIVLDGADRGKVTRIGLRSTRILTRDDKEINIPNSVIARSKIINESTGRWVKQRLRIPVSVAYGSDVDQVKKILLDAVNFDKRICEDPAPWIKFDQFGQSSLDFEIRCWIDDPELRGRIQDGINTRVYKSLGENGVEIPYPKRDLYIKELPSSFSLAPPAQDTED